MSIPIFNVEPTRLHQVAQYRLLLYEIMNSTAEFSTKVALLQSLKQTLEVTLLSESKKNELRTINLHNKKPSLKERQSQLLLGSKDEREVSASENMRVCHKSIISQICQQYELRDHLTISLSQMQELQLNLSSKYQRQVRHNDYKGQSNTLLQMRLTHNKMRQVLNALNIIKGSVGIEYEMLLDNIKILKVKHSLLKKELPQHKLQRKREIQKGKGKQKVLYGLSIQLSNQNRNQILVNL